MIFLKSKLLAAMAQCIILTVLYGLMKAGLLKPKGQVQLTD